MRLAAGIALLIACSDDKEVTPPAAAPPPSPTSTIERTPLPTMSALVSHLVSALEHGRRADIENMVFTDREIRRACRDKPELATSVVAQRDPAGFSKRHRDHRATYERCFALPWAGAKHQVVGSLLGTTIRGCSSVEVVAFTIVVETAKGSYLLEITDAVQIGGQAGLTTLPACKPAQ